MIKTLVVNGLHYLVYDSFESESWSATRSFSKVDKYPISNSLLEDAKNNPFEVLRTINSPSKALIIQSETVFLRAFARNEVEYFWVFVENLFIPLFNENKEIRKKFSKVLIKVIPDLKHNFLFQIGLVFTPFGFNPKQENLTTEDANFIYSNIVVKHNHDFDLNQYRPKLESVFLKEIIDYHTSFYTEHNKAKWKTHFDSLLIDLYGYRNTLLHTGKTDPYSKIKFSYVIPKLFSRARWLMIHECMRNPNLSYEALIDLLTS